MIHQISDRAVKEAIVSNQWAYGQLFPEVMSPGPSPHDLKFKTHVFSSTFTDTVNTWSETSFDPAQNAFVQHPERRGKMWIYFSPVNDLLSLSSPLSSGVSQDILNDNSIFYSSSNGPLPYSAFTIFDHREITLNSSSKKNISLTGYKKLRVTSGAIIIRQLGPVKDRSGVLKIGFSFKGAIETVPSINFDKFQDYFNISEIIPLNTSSEIICRYRLPTHMINMFAPFEPTLNLPYFFIYGEGISPTMSFDIEVVRHFEGIVMSEYSNFHNPGHQPKQFPFDIQNKIVRNVERKENIIQNISVDKNKSTRTHPPLLSRRQETAPLSENRDPSIYESAFKEIGDAARAVVSDVVAQGKEKAKEAMRKIFINQMKELVPQSLKNKTKLLTDIAKKVYDPSKTVYDNAYSYFSEAAEKGIQLGGDFLSNLDIF